MFIHANSFQRVEEEKEDKCVREREEKPEGKENGEEMIGIGKKRHSKRREKRGRGEEGDAVKRGKI